MYIKSNPLTKIASFYLLLVFLFSFSSCYNWNAADEFIIVRTDVKVHITVKDYQTNYPVPEQLVTFAFNIYNGSTNTDSNIREGQVITDGFGKADIPIYDCQLNAGLLVRFSAQIPGQNSNDIIPLSVSFDDALDAANDENYAEILIEYEIIK